MIGIHRDFSGFTGIALTLDVRKMYQVKVLRMSVFGTSRGTISASVIFILILTPHIHILSETPPVQILVNIRCVCVCPFFFPLTPSLPSYMRSRSVIVLYSTNAVAEYVECVEGCYRILFLKGVCCTKLIVEYVEYVEESTKTLAQRLRTISSSKIPA